MQLQRIFGPQGHLAQNFSRYQYRSGQLEMASAVAEALKNGSHAAIQAGTGLGKTFSYLIPAIIEAVSSNKRVVVSTRTINLQEQIIKKDIPTLKRVLQGVLDFEAVLVKGRGNYLCRRKLDTIGAIQTTLLKSSDDVVQWQELWDMYKGNKLQQGDLDELPFRPNDTLWMEVASESDLCVRRECIFHSQCYFYKARARQKEAQILVTNHALFFADLAIRGQQGNKDDFVVIEGYNGVVFDEAQSIEDVATDFLSSEVSFGRYNHLAFSTRAALRPNGTLQWQDEASYKLIDHLLGQLGEKFKAFFIDLNKQYAGDTVRLLQPGIVEDFLSADLLNLRDELNALAAAAQSEEQNTTLKTLAARAQELAEDTQLICGLGKGDQYAYWLESNKEFQLGGRLACAPVSIAQKLKESLFAQVPVVLTSATLSSALLKRVGLTDFKALRLESPYDYAKQAILYVPLDGPDPAAGEAFDEFTARRVQELVQISGGRTFVLFTSYRSMQTVYRQISGSLEQQGYLPVMQGDMRRDELLAKFVEHGRATLFAVASFWEGVDVPGEALSQVILVKLPFLVPTEPITQARMEAVQKSGQDPFEAFTVPQAVLRLKQGFGRLLRSETDRGVIAILDKRILTKRYGKSFIKALPPAPKTNSIRDVQSFFGH